VRMKRKQSRKGTNNNSNGWNPVNPIPVTTCWSQEGPVFPGCRFNVTISRQMLKEDKMREGEKLCGVSF
jgi:hypothetical protein